MTDPTSNESTSDPATPTVPPVPPQMNYAPMPSAGYPPAQFGPGPIGKTRGTGVSILLFIVTFGIYSIFWYYFVHDEMKRHKGTGIGGGIALLLAFFVGIAMPYITSSEAGELYERRGQAKPVSAMTGLWYLPGMFILVGPIIWFVKTNGAINAYWRSLGAR